MEKTLFCQMALLLVHLGPKLPKMSVVPLFTSINGFGDGSYGVVFLVRQGPLGMMANFGQS